MPVHGSRRLTGGDPTGRAGSALGCRTTPGQGDEQQPDGDGRRAALGRAHVDAGQGQAGGGGGGRRRRGRPARGRRGRPGGRRGGRAGRGDGRVQPGGGGRGEVEVEHRHLTQLDGQLPGGV